MGVSNKFAFYKDRSGVKLLKKKGEDEGGAGGRQRKGINYIVCPCLGSCLAGTRHPLAVPSAFLTAAGSRAIFI